MSYHIIYKRCFIKASHDGSAVIPMILSGDNNCYQAGGRGQRRERNWNLLWNKDLILTRKESDEKLIGFTKEKGFDDSSFGDYLGTTINGKQPSYTQFKKFVNNGFKNAFTVEDIISKRGSLFVNYRSDKESDIESLEICSTEDIIKVQTALLLLKPYYFTIELSDDERFLKKLFSKGDCTTRAMVEIKDPYAIYIPNKGYLIRQTRRGFRYNYDCSQYNTKVFTGQRQAERYIENQFTGNNAVAKKIEGATVSRVKTTRKHSRTVEQDMAEV